MLTFNCHVDASEIGEQLAYSPRQLKKAVVAIADDFPDDLCIDAVDLMTDEDKENVTLFLERFLHAVKDEPHEA